MRRGAQAKNHRKHAALLCSSSCLCHRGIFAARALSLSHRRGAQAAGAAAFKWARGSGRGSGRAVSAHKGAAKSRSQKPAIARKLDHRQHGAQSAPRRRQRKRDKGSRSARENGGKRGAILSPHRGPKSILSGQPAIAQRSIRISARGAIARRALSANPTAFHSI